MMHRHELQCGWRAFVSGLLCCSAVASASAMPPRDPWRAPARDDAHIISRNLWSWTELKERNVIMQKKDYSCGAAALATLIKYHLGDNASEDTVLRTFEGMVTPEVLSDRVLHGMNMNDLESLAQKMHYDTLKGTLSFEQLAQSKVPLIVGITVKGYDHFVVYRGTDWEYVYLADPIRGNVRVPGREFVQQWQKNGALAVVHPDRDPPAVTPLSLRASEIYLGTLNRLEVRKALTRPTTVIPMQPR